MGNLLFYVGVAAVMIGGCGLDDNFLIALAYIIVGTLVAWIGHKIAPEDAATSTRG